MNTPRERPADSSGGGTSAAASARDISFLLVTLAVVLGFTYRFAYMERLGAEMELGSQPVPQLAVDALQAISAQWVTCCVATASALVVLALGRLALRAGRLPLHPQELNAVILIALTLSLSVLAFKGGHDQADHFYHREFAGQDPLAHEIFIPVRAKETDECYDRDLAVPTPSPPEIPSTLVYWYLTAQSPDGYHVIRQTVVRDGSEPKVEPIVFTTGMLKCFQQLDTRAPRPSVAAAAPVRQVARAAR